MIDPLTFSGHEHAAAVRAWCSGAGFHADRARLNARDPSAVDPRIDVRPFDAIVTKLGKRPSGFATAACEYLIADAQTADNGYREAWDRLYTSWTAIHPNTVRPHSITLPWQNGELADELPSIRGLQQAVRETCALAYQFRRIEYANRPKSDGERSGLPPLIIVDEALLDPIPRVSAAQKRAVLRTIGNNIRMMTAARHDLCTAGQAAAWMSVGTHNMHRMLRPDAPTVCPGSALSEALRTSEETIAQLVRDNRDVYRSPDIDKAVGTVVDEKHALLGALLGKRVLPGMVIDRISASVGGVRGIFSL